MEGWCIWLKVITQMWLFLCIPYNVSWLVTSTKGWQSSPKMTIINIYNVIIRLQLFHWVIRISAQNSQLWFWPFDSVHILGLLYRHDGWSHGSTRVKSEWVSVRFLFSLLNPEAVIRPQISFRWIHFLILRDAFRNSVFSRQNQPKPLYKDIHDYPANEYSPFESINLLWVFFIADRN